MIITAYSVRFSVTWGSEIQTLSIKLFQHRDVDSSLEPNIYNVLLKLLSKSY